jgi:tRNA-dihydrouridine synthase
MLRGSEVETKEDRWRAHVGEREREREEKLIAARRAKETLNLDTDCFYDEASGRTVERDATLQLGLASVEEAEEAATSLLALPPPSLSHVGWIELNLGCPQPTAAKCGFGAFLAGNAEKVRAIISCLVCRLGSRFRIAAKIRISLLFAETVSLVDLLVSLGVQRISIHGRTREAGREGEADLRVVRAIGRRFEHSPVQILSNGNCTSLSLSLSSASRTRGVHGLLIGEPLLVSPLAAVQLSLALCGALNVREREREREGEGEGERERGREVEVDAALALRDGGDPYLWRLAASADSKKVPRVAVAKMYMYTVQQLIDDQPTPSASLSLSLSLFRPAREHLLHMLGYRRRSFAQFASFGETGVFLLHQAGVRARSVRTAVRTATDLASLSLSLSSLAEYVAVTPVPAPVIATGQKRSRK